LFDFGLEAEGFFTAHRVFSLELKRTQPEMGAPTTISIATSQPDEKPARQPQQKVWGAAKPYGTL